jgi:type II secretory pathway pseudopilin PulG
MQTKPPQNRPTSKSGTVRILARRRCDCLLPECKSCTSVAADGLSPIASPPAPLLAHGALGLGGRGSGIGDFRLPPSAFPRPPSRHRRTARIGFSLLEFQVAFVIFGVALAGLGPLVVMQSRQLRKLESRLDDQTTHYLVASKSAWARKLGASASIQTTDPGPPPPPPVTLVDNGNPGYRETDVGVIDWQSELRSHAFHGTVRWNNGGGVGDKAQWQFTGLAPGWYQVLVTFPNGGDQASDAPYTVYDGSLAKGTVRIDQRVAPSGPIFEGSRWASLGLFSIVGDTLRVELSDDADGNIVADAVRIVPVRNVVQIVSLEKSLVGEEMTAHLSVTVLTP